MEKNSVLEKNLTALKASFPELCSLVEDQLEKLPQDIEQKCECAVWSEKGPSGDSVILVEKDGFRYYLNGKYDPEAMADRQLCKIEDRGYESLVFVVGVCDGRVLQRLTEKLDKGSFILVYEPAVEIFFHAISNYDLTALLQRDKLALVVDGLNGETLKDVMEFVVVADLGDRIQTLVLGNYEKICFCEVKKSLELLRKTVEMMMIQWRTRMLNMHVSTENCVRNMRYLEYHYSADVLYGILPKQVPAIVVAAGPSLDNNIQMLIKTKGKACIIACDTALKPLLRHGIVPDFFVLLDPRKPLELFDFPGAMEIPMISGINVPSEIMKSHQGKKFFFLDQDLEVELYEKVFGKDCQKIEHRISPISNGGSVATTAFSVARLLGAETIILVGQDLAITKDKGHASGTFGYEEDYSKVIDHLPKVEGIGGGMVPTLVNLKLYLEWFEEEIAEYPELQVIDATEGGALIHGSKVMSLEDAINMCCTVECQMKSLIDNLPMHFDQRQRQKAYEFMMELPGKLMKVRRILQDGEKTYQQLEQYALKKSYSVDDLKKLLRKIRKINRSLDKMAIVKLLFEGIKKEEYRLRISMYEFQTDQQQDLLETAKKGQTMMRSLLEMADQIRPEFESLAQEMSLKC